MDRTASCSVSCALPAGSTGAALARTAPPSWQEGGDETKPNPTGRGRFGTKRHLITDRNGAPLAFVLTVVNTSDSMPFEALPHDTPSIVGEPGRERRRLDKLYADKTYDHRRCRHPARAG